MTGLSGGRDDPAVFLRPQVVRVSLWAVLGLWLARRLFRLLVLIARSPAALTMIGLTAGVVTSWQLVSPALPLGILGGLAAWLIGWRWRWPASFSVHAADRVRGWWRGAWVYRRRWAVAMDTVGLTKNRHGADYVPPLLSVRSNRWMDKLTVRMLPGQRMQDFVDLADRLYPTFGAVDCRVRTTKNPHKVQLWLLINDPLNAVVDPFPPADNLADGLPVARCEDGTPWLLRLLGNHVLIVGATGAGKSGVLWCIIAALASFIRAGTVKIWAVDPKGGMELAFGRPLFDRFAYGNTSAPGGYEASLALLLEDAVHVMRERADRLMGVTRLHTPTVDEPLIVLLIDEIAALTGWITDRTMKKRIDSALSLLLTQGRAVGVVVIGAVQDPRKDVIPQRDLFTIRIGLRVNEADHVRLSLGSDAYNRGAACERIPDTLQGVGYVAQDGVPDPARVRFAWHSDDTIAQLTGPPVAEGPVLTLIGDAA
jgi:DNA segregation ATPase FtsK/SpoIIIE, S-DNA-T family